MKQWIFRDLTPKDVIELPDSSAKPGQAAHAPLCVRRKQTHFIDARKLGTLIDSVHRELTDEGLKKITSTYHLRRGDDLTRSREVREAKASETKPLRDFASSREYFDIPGFCKSAIAKDSVSRPRGTGVRI